MHLEPGGTPVVIVVPGTPAPVPTSAPAIVVTRPHQRPPLPFTGFDITAALLVAVLLVAVGVASLLSARGSRTA